MQVEKKGEGFVQSMRELGKDFCPNSTQNVLESIDRRRRNIGSRELIPLFHNPRRNGQPSPPAVALT